MSPSMSYVGTCTCTSNETSDSFSHHIMTPLFLFPFSRISYDYLLEASFRNRTFIIAYRTLNTQGEQVDKRLLLRCQHHRIARYLFRLLTENHTFFCHETVSERVLDHVRYRPWQEIGSKYFGRSYDRVYHFDVLRTQHEAYSHAWGRLHQVDQNALTAHLSITVHAHDEVSSSLPNHETESDFAST